MSDEKKREIVCYAIKRDEPTQNGRIYSQHVLEKMVYEFNKMSQQRRALVLKDNPPDGRMLLTNVAGKVNDTQLRDGRLVCQVELLETEAGKSIEDMFFSEDVSIEPVAFGKVDDFGHVVPEDLKLLGFSFVYNPPKK